MASKQHKLFYGSSPDRGLDMLLFMWPDIRKEFPDAELHVCYGWKLFDIMARTNPERRQWKESVLQMMQYPGIVDHGRVGKDELKEIRSSCGIWAYPTYFTEINCITALECQRDGVVPVVIDLAALREVVGAGVIVEGDIKDPQTMKKFQEELISLMKDGDRWKKESRKAIKHSNKYDWSTVAREWLPYFLEPVENPMVSIITPTIRTGFWNIMAHNLSIQSYKNFEWIIVDDYPEDRSDIAKAYADKYNLEVRYLRGGKGSNYPRRCALVKANNIGWQNAKGELLVWLQDFCLMPQFGIERMVDIYRKHKDDLIAPVDVYYHALPANKDNKEDWWDGNTQIITAKGWTNPRVVYEGLKQTENPFDFEMNYSGIPRKVLERINGWYEFMDDGLGYDNTEVAYRALMTGSKIWLDDSNIAKCINIWPTVSGTEENILNRERILNPPRYYWMSKQFKSGKLPLVRDIKLDESIKLEFEVPDMPDKDAKDWIKEHTEEIASNWPDIGGDTNAVSQYKTKKVDVGKQKKLARKWTKKYVSKIKK